MPDAGNTAGQFGLVVGVAIVLAQGLVEVAKAVVKQRNGKRNSTNKVGGLTQEQDRQLFQLFTSHEGNAAIRPDGTRRWWFPDKLLTTQDKILTELRSMNTLLGDVLKERHK